MSPEAQAAEFVAFTLPPGGGYRTRLTFPGSVDVLLTPRANRTVARLEAEAVRRFVADVIRRAQSQPAA